MSAGLLDELEVPKAPRLWVCPCCKFSFAKPEAYVEHLNKMRALIDSALAEAKKPEAKK